MKKNMAALELHYLIKELDLLIDSKVDRIYHPKKKELVINFYISGKGKKMLRIVVPSYIYVTSYKQEYPQNPSNFCVYLRKKLDNTRLKEINQMGFERIIEFVFESKHSKFRLIFELFSKGNIVLCAEDYTILRPLEVQRWSMRTVKPKVVYDYPKKEVNFLDLGDNLKGLLEKSKKNLVKTLAIDLGLGGVYAEELCLLAKVDKEQKGAENIKNLIKAGEKLKKSKVNAFAVYEKQNVEDIVPIKLEFYKDFEKKEFKTYNDALDLVLTKRIVKQEKEQKLSKHEKKIEKLKIIIQKQGEHVKKLEKDIEDNTKKAEIVYNNYKKVENILNELREISKKHSWKDIKEKLKGHKIVKEINSKEKSVVLELKK